jgi:hypothetical protein
MGIPVHVIFMIPGMGIGACAMGLIVVTIMGVPMLLVLVTMCVVLKILAVVIINVYVSITNENSYSNTYS